MRRQAETVSIGRRVQQPIARVNYQRAVCLDDKVSHFLKKYYVEFVIFQTQKTAATVCRSDFQVLDTSNYLEINSSSV